MHVDGILARVLKVATSTRHNPHQAISFQFENRPAFVTMEGGSATPIPKWDITNPSLFFP